MSLIIGKYSFEEIVNSIHKLDIKELGKLSLLITYDAVSYSEEELTKIYQLLTDRIIILRREKLS